MGPPAQKLQSLSITTYCTVSHYCCNQRFGAKPILVGFDPMDISNTGPEFGSSLTLIGTAGHAGAHLDNTATSKANISMMAEGKKKI